MENFKNIKLVDKYIGKQLLETFLLGVSIFTSIIFASDAFLTLVKQISTYGISFKIAILLIILKLPSVLVLTIPMGVLFSTVMSINKMSINSEITIMRACGISIQRLARPVFIFGFVAMLLCFCINEFIVPLSNAQSKNLTVWVLSQKNIPSGKKNFSFKELNNGNGLKRLFYIASTEKDHLEGVTLLDLSKSDTIQIVQSKYGKTTPDYLMFNEGAVYSVTSKAGTLNTTVFNNLKLFNTLNIKDTVNNLKTKEMNFFELSNYLKQNSNLKELPQLLIELYEKISIPAAAFIFALIGLPLAITPPRIRYNRGFLFSILIIFVYYLLKAFSTSMGSSQMIEPIFAAWIPNLVLGITGGFMFYKKAYTI